MPNNFPGDNLKSIWQHQPIEASTMTLEKVSKRARELHARTRRQLLGTLAGPLTTAFCYAFGIKEFPPLRPVLQSLFAFALAWSLAGLYFLNRGSWSAAIPAEAGLSAGLEFCRREIERRRDYLRRVLLWGLGPVLLSLWTIIMGLAMVGTRERGIFPNALPFLILVVVWVSSYFAIRLRDQHELQREIDELNTIEKENKR
jgi:hypothetical protein